MRLVLALASLKLTPFALALLGGASVAVYRFEDSATPWLAAPLMLLALNLIAAVATNGVFRKQQPLLVFHLALISLVLLAAAGRLSFLQGHAEVTTGAPFSGLLRADAGPLHGGLPERVNFINDGFDIFYTPGPTTDRVVAYLRWRDEQGVERLTEVDKTRPLVQFGYRIVPTTNKGFAPILRWQPVGGGEAELVALHLPGYPGHAERQSITWRPGDDAEEIWLQLQVEEGLIPADQASRFRLPQQQTLVVRRLDQRWELEPGERIELPEGTLEYQGLTTWMGYAFFYDWTIPWLLAACALAVASLGWHFWRKFAAVPWNREPEHGT